MNGDVEAHSESDMVERSRHCLVADQSGPFANDKRPHTPWSSPLLWGLATLQPATLATMHGSPFTGNNERALNAPVLVITHVLGASASR
jgi:hypothetical protein